MGLAEFGSYVLLFLLVFGMSATTDIHHVRKQMKNSKALLAGVTLQFLILPFVGFVVVKILRLDTPTGVTLLVVTSSPGGSYSNWWCSLFNAELALSVTMTAISTLLSIVMLPINLLIYTAGSYSTDVVQELDWGDLFISLIVVIGGIGGGIISSAVMNSTRFNLNANKLGNLAGIALVTYSALVSSSSENDKLWSQDAKFYFAIMAPALIGVSVATWLASKCNLEKPERVAVAVEACYQNTGIATSVAIAMFSGADQAKAVSVPLFYGVCEMVILACYCLCCWKIGWTKAPADENICTVITTSYEVEKANLESPNAIEVVHNENQKDEEDAQDVVFNQTLQGYQVDQQSLHERPNAMMNSMLDSSDNSRIEGDDTLPADGKELT
jgi:predicted Na+-dependent transporter